MNKLIIGIIIAIGGGAYLLNNSSQNQGQIQTGPPTGSPQAITGKNDIKIQNFSFSPATLTIKVGDKVTWTNQDTAGHSATADNGTFDTGILSQGQSGSITFSNAVHIPTIAVFIRA